MVSGGGARGQPLFNQLDKRGQLPHALAALARLKQGKLVVHLPDPKQMIDEAVTDPHFASDGRPCLPRLQ